MFNKFKNRHFSPEEFRKKISDMNPLLVKNNNINNIKDLLLYLIFIYSSI